MDAKEIVSLYLDSMDKDAEIIGGNFGKKRMMLAALLTQEAITHDTFIMGMLLIDVAEALH